MASGRRGGGKVKVSNATTRSFSFPFPPAIPIQPSQRDASKSTSTALPTAGVTVLYAESLRSTPLDIDGGGCSISQPTIHSLSLPLSSINRWHGPCLFCSFSLFVSFVFPSFLPPFGWIVNLSFPSLPFPSHPPARTFPGLPRPPAPPPALNPGHRWPGLGRPGRGGGVLGFW